MAYEGMQAYGQGLLGSGATSTERSPMASAAIRNRGTAGTAATAAGSQKGFFGDLVGSITGSEWLGAGLSILGGFMGDRSDRRASREDRRFNREQNELNRQVTRESNLQQLRAGMQSDQDQYAREIVRNRGAIAPWAERYRGPAFTTATPNAPIYNPLMEEGHLYGQLDPVNPVRAPAPPTPPKPAPRRRKK